MLKGEVFMKSRKIILATLAIVTSAVVSNLSAQESLVGFWVAHDEGAPGVSSVVELYVHNKQLNGRIVLTRNAEGHEIHPVCEKCSGRFRGSPIKGMTFISGLSPLNRDWVGGQVTDLRPGFTQGMVASCDISMVNGRAIILGYFMSRAWGKSSAWIRQ
jgi:hypothetical protein